MDQILKNKKILLEEIEKCGEKPITQERSFYLNMCYGAYKALCVASGEDIASMHHMAHTEYTSRNEVHMSRFNWRMAEDWTAGMKNADGTRGPHFSMDRVKEIMQEHQVDYDPVEFYAALNSVYSDFSEALKENNVSNMKVYVSLAKAWIDDPDAVHDKAAAYYTYVVKH